MEATSTDYIMVVGSNDIVDVTGPLISGVHYLQTHVRTRRAFRHSRPLGVYHFMLLLQLNYLGMPIFHRSLIPLFPGASIEPWHRLMVRAQTQGAGFSVLAGSHTIVDPWPRPELTGAYSEFDCSMDPEAVMEAVPGILVTPINNQPFYRLRNPVAEGVTAFCRNCSIDFMSNLAALNVSVQTMTEFNYARIRACNTNFVAWFDGIEEAVDNEELLNQLHVGLQFPGVLVISPRFVTDFTIATYHHPAFSLRHCIGPGFNSAAWMTQTRNLGGVPPSAGYVNNQVILRKTL